LALDLRLKRDADVIGCVGDRKLGRPARMLGGPRNEQVQRLDAIELLDFPVGGDRNNPPQPERLDRIGGLEQRRQQQDGGGDASNHSIMIISTARIGFSRHAYPAVTAAPNSIPTRAGRPAWRFHPARLQSAAPPRSRSCALSS